MIAKVSFSKRNVAIIGITFSFGIGLTTMKFTINIFLVFSMKILISSSATVCCILSIIASILFQIGKKDKELMKSAMQDDQSPIS